MNGMRPAFVKWLLQRKNRFCSAWQASIPSWLIAMRDLNVSNRTVKTEYSWKSYHVQAFDRSIAFRPT